MLKKTQSVPTNIVFRQKFLIKRIFNRKESKMLKIQGKVVHTKKKQKKVPINTNKLTEIQLRRSKLE